MVVYFFSKKFEAADLRKVAVVERTVTATDARAVSIINPEIVDGVLVTAPAHHNILECRPQKQIDGLFIYVSEINAPLTTIWKEASLGSEVGSLITRQIQGYGQQRDAFRWPKNAKSFTNVATDPPIFFCFQGSDMLFLIDRNNWTTSKLLRLIANYDEAKACLLPRREPPAVEVPKGDDFLGDDFFGQF